MKTWVQVERDVFDDFLFQYYADGGGFREYEKEPDDLAWKDQRGCLTRIMCRDFGGVAKKEYTAGWEKLFLDATNKNVIDFFLKKGTRG